MADQEDNLQLQNIFNPAIPVPPADNIQVAPEPFDAGAYPPPPNFPPHIMLDNNRHTYRNWCWDIEVDNVWIAIPNSYEQVREIADWAVYQSYKIRPVGMMHNWSPIVMDKGATAPVANILLVSTQLLNRQQFAWQGDIPTATFGTGVTIETATDYLEGQDNKGKGLAPGFSFINMTGPGDISLGGALAVGAHGTSIPIEANPADRLGGSLSNLILSFTAVVSDPANPGKHILKTFLRSDADAPAFLVNLGRAFIVEVTLRVVPNYYLNQTNHFVPIASAFCAPEFSGLPRSLHKYVEKSGRVEVIWFPGTEFAWVKTWDEVDALVGNTTRQPYNENFTFLSDARNIYVRNLLKSKPWLNPAYFTTALNHVRNNAYKQLSGTSRNMLLYVKPSTLRLTALGYCIQISRADIQVSVHDFIQGFNSIMKGYPLKYPVSGAVELRFTSMDLTDQLGMGEVQPPSFSASRSVKAADPSLDTVFWADILSIPGINENTYPFFAEMEQWIFDRWGDKVRPEWSKGWACTTEGEMWKNPDVIQRIKTTYYADTYEYTRSTLAKYDQNHIYTNNFLEVLLPGANNI